MSDAQQRAAEVIRSDLGWDWCNPDTEPAELAAALAAAGLLVDDDTARSVHRVNADGMTIEDVLRAHRDDIAGYDAERCVQALRAGGWLVDDLTAQQRRLGEAVEKVDQIEHDSPDHSWAVGWRDCLGIIHALAEKAGADYSAVIPGLPPDLPVEPRTGSEGPEIAQESGEATLETARWKVWQVRDPEREAVMFSIDHHERDARLSAEHWLERAGEGYRLELVTYERKLTPARIVEREVVEPRSR